MLTSDVQDVELPSYQTHLIACCRDHGMSERLGAPEQQEICALPIVCKGKGKGKGKWGKGKLDKCNELYTKCSMGETVSETQGTTVLHVVLKI